MTAISTVENQFREQDRLLQKRAFNERFARIITLLEQEQPAADGQAENRSA